ncbi:MAG TPA: Rieske (2Fe-2S) protein [Xanthobacteraceae bacterium]|nr:Rieske (2Fe-2S) protein [Xanthobacteraceae bacterium]
MEDIYVARVDEFEDLGRKLLVHGDTEVGVFHVDGGFVAWRNECAHQGGPVCQGRLFPKVEEPLSEERTVHGMRYMPGTMHIVCPWHGYEYDVRTGRNAGHQHLRLKKVDVVVKEGAVYVRL